MWVLVTYLYLTSWRTIHTVYTGVVYLFYPLVNDVTHHTTRAGARWTVIAWLPIINRTFYTVTSANGPNFPTTLSGRFLNQRMQKLCQNTRRLDCFYGVEILTVVFFVLSRCVGVTGKQTDGEYFDPALDTISFTWLSYDMYMIVKSSATTATFIALCKHGSTIHAVYDNHRQQSIGMPHLYKWGRQQPYSKSVEVIRVMCIYTNEPAVFSAAAVWHLCPVSA